MAAYNGEKYIAQQIESILKQTTSAWKLVIQDDCSSDATYDIAKDYARKYGEKVQAVKREFPSGSAKNNFFSMMRFASDDYIMFCDDDDIWLPEKIETTMRQMKQLEDKFGKKTPLLVHTDLKVVDANLREISPSFFQMQKLDRTRVSFANLLSQNIVTGCTTMANRPLMELAQNTPAPESAVMHDWWLALVASGFGKIDVVNKPTILYRQHGSNEIGAKNAGNLRYNVQRLLNRADTKEAVRRTYLQADNFHRIYGKQLMPEKQNVLNEYCALPQKTKVCRLYTIQKYDFWKSGWIRRAGQIWFS